jgi:chloramphenicol 3-O phosphotransferase
MNDSFTVGKIIIINGPSSSGKSTLALAAQKQFDIPFLRFSFDLFLDNKSLPLDQIRNGTFSWETMRPSVFHGLHRCLPALANAGNNLIVDHIIESKSWLEDLLQCVSNLDVYFVGLHCSLEELERREVARGNRRSGEARTDYESVHSITSYDLELDSENALEDNVKLLIEAWKNRKKPCAMDRMIREMDISPS